jgi:hypothetical protein
LEQEIAVAENLRQMAAYHQLAKQIIDDNRNTNMITNQILHMPPLTAAPIHHNIDNIIDKFEL